MRPTPPPRSPEAENLSKTLERLAPRHTNTRPLAEESISKWLTTEQDPYRARWLALHTADVRAPASPAQGEPHHSHTRTPGIVAQPR